MLSRRHVLAGSSALSLLRNKPAKAAIAPNYVLNLGSVTAPALPRELTPNIGTWLTTSSISPNAIYTTSVGSGTYTKLFFPGSSSSSTAFSFTVQYANTSAPTNSYCYPGFQSSGRSNEYEVNMSRGTGESRGAIWIQKLSGGSTSILSSFVGASGTTFVANTAYTVTIVSTGTSTVTITCQVQRLSDGLYLTSSGAWSSTKQVCITTTDSSSPFPQTGITCLNANQTVLDFYITGWSVNNVNPPITEVSTSPVLAKGGTYNGWKADAWAAPPWTDDGTQWVMAPNPWSIANGQWATTFFTCPYSGGMQTWTYISGSILTPANFGVAGDYIIGDGGLIWWNNAYYMSYVHGPSGGPWYIGIAKTTNLAGGPSAWTKINTTLISNGADNNLAINPSTGYLELWWMNPATSPRTIYMHNSPDGTTWTAQGLQYTAPSFDFGGDFGAPSVTYLTYPLPGMPVGTRIMTNDLSPISSGYRYSMMSYSVDAGTDWTFAGIINGLNPNASWEDAQTFDGRIGLADIGDGRGKILRLIYAGSDTNSPTDNTDSSIGLGTLVSLPDNLQLGVGIR